MRATSRWSNGVFEVAALVVLANDAWVSARFRSESFGARREEELARLRGFDC